MVQFRLLGPVEVWADDRPVDAGPPRQRAVLAALLVDAGRAVSPEVLVDRVWGGSAPREARRSLHAHIARIRRMLRQADAAAGPSAGSPAAGSPAAGSPADRGAGARPDLLRRSGGYVLAVDADRVDGHRFRGLVERARDPGCDEQRRVELLREALSLWRGEPLAGLTGAWAERTRQSWSRQLPDAAVAWAHAELRVGNPDPVISRLTELIAEHPLMESPVAALMRALHAAGRPAEALMQYAALRERLATELGADPGSEPQAVHQAILRGEEVGPPPVPTGPAQPPAASAKPPAAPLVPAQLPPDVAGFAGRAEHLGQLNKLLAEAMADTSAAALIAVVSGTAGIGKTALAVHWAHRVAERFPDGQLYVNLRGFDAAGRVVSAGDAVRGFLGALGVPPAGIPGTLDDQAALYRSLLAGKRTLVVLDNARDVEQVRPLLPGGGTTVTVITSRNQLTGLVSVEGAHPVTLDLLSHSEAHDLLARRIDPDRVAAEPAAVEAIITGCARLPLALAVAAARARQTGFPLAALAEELAETHARLDTLDGGDPASQVRSVFSWSYAALSPAAARLFRLFGVHPGPEISAAAAASLAGQPPSAVRPLLAEMVRSGLVSEHLPGRYAFHDLLRSYAADLALSDDEDDARRAATIRLLDHYAHTAHAADRLLIPRREPMSLPLGPAADGVRIEPLADDRRALEWLTAEHHVLLAVLAHAAGAGFDRYAWQLAWSLETFLDRRGHWHDRIAVWLAALPGAERLGDPAAEALLHARLAVAHARLGHHEAAYAHLPRALSRFAQAGDHGGQAHTYRHYAYLAAKQGDPRRALDYAKQALELFQTAGDVRGQAIVLNSIGWYSAQIGDYHGAVEHCEESLALLLRLDDRDPLAATWDSLGYAHHHLGNHARAAACYREALALHRALADRYHEADVLTRLGETRLAAGDPLAARDDWRTALSILTDLDHPDAEGVRDRLRRLAAADRR